MANDSELKCKHCKHEKKFHEKQGCKWLHQGAGGGLFGVRCACKNFEPEGADGVAIEL